MKLFLDTADNAEVARHFGTGLIDGVTTNPTLIRKSGRKPQDVYRELMLMGVKDISMEIVGEAPYIVAEAHNLVEEFGEVCTIKVPCTPYGLRACVALSEDNIKVNVTLIFSPSQAILAAKAGAKYVSPFVGRVDDNSFGGICLVKDIVKVFKEHFVTTEVLAASVRNVRDVGRLFEHGAEIVTMPPGVFDKMYNHVLTDAGLEQFDKDWSEVQGR